MKDGTKPGAADIREKNQDFVVVTNLAFPNYCMIVDYVISRQGQYNRLHVSNFC